MTSQNIHMSPHKLSMLMHFYTTPAPFPGRNAPHYLSTETEFKRLGLIKRDERGEIDEEYVWITTPLGNAWVEAILAVEPPTIRMAIESSGEFGGWFNE